MQHNGTCGHCGTTVNPDFNTCKGCGATWKANINAFHSIVLLLCLFGWFVGAAVCFLGTGMPVAGIIIIGLTTLLWRKVMRNPKFAWFR